MLKQVLVKAGTMLTHERIKLKAWIFVIVQFTYSPLVVVLAYLEYKFMQRQPGDLLFYLSILIYIFAVISGIAALISFRQKITPLPIPREDSIMIENGIYFYIRHPMYLSVMLFILGFILFVQAYYTLPAFLLLVYFFILKIKFEENLLIEKFPEYRSYQSKTKRLIPFIY